MRSEREIKWENGDRDGGDQRPQEKRPEEPEVKPVFAQNPPEENLSGGIQLTQPELKNIIEANTETVTVVSDGVKAELPTATLKNIPLEPDESLTVLLEQPEENAFDIRIYAGIREINAWGDAPIKVTVPNPGGAKQAQPQSNGDPIPAEKTADGKVVFPVSETGTYVMDTPPAKQETQNLNTKPSIWIWLSCALLLAISLLTGYLFLRKRRANL